MPEDTETVEVGRESWQNINNWFGYLTGDVPDNPSAGLVSEARRRLNEGEAADAVLADVLTKLEEGRQAIMPQ